MKRRVFIALAGGAVAAPLVSAHAQQSAMPALGSSGPHRLRRTRTFGARFVRGLKENGCVEGDNVVITQRWADNKMDQLPGLAADLVRRRVAAID